MPTSFTSPIIDGDIGPEDFASWVLAVSKVYASPLEVRDRPPLAVPPATYSIESYEERAEDARATLEYLEACTPEAIEATYVDHCATIRRKQTEITNDYGQADQRLEAFLALVEEWDAPPEAERLKAYVRQQLRDSVSNPPFMGLEAFLAPSAQGHHDTRVMQARQALDRANETLRVARFNLAEWEKLQAAVRSSLGVEETEVHPVV